MSKRVFPKGKVILIIVGVTFAGAVLIASIEKRVSSSHFLASRSIDLDSCSASLKRAISDTTQGMPFPQSRKPLLLGSSEAYAEHTRVTLEEVLIGVWDGESKWVCLHLVKEKEMSTWRVHSTTADWGVSEWTTRPTVDMLFHHRSSWAFVPADHDLRLLRQVYFNGSLQLFCGKKLSFVRLFRFVARDWYRRHRASDTLLLSSLEGEAAESESRQATNQIP